MLLPTLCSSCFVLSFSRNSHNMFHVASHRAFIPVLSQRGFSDNFFTLWVSPSSHSCARVTRMLSCAIANVADRNDEPTCLYRRYKQPGSSLRLVAIVLHYETVSYMYVCMQRHYTHANITFSIWSSCTTLLQICGKPNS